MPTVSHVPQMETPTLDHDPVEGYRALALAIVKQALQDATGDVFAPGPQSPNQVQAEARAWLAEETGLRYLVELAGFESVPLLRRVRQLLQAPQVVQLVAQAPQLTLF